MNTMTPIKKIDLNPFPLLSFLKEIDIKEPKRKDNEPDLAPALSVLFLYPPDETKIYPIEKEKVDSLVEHIKTTYKSKSQVGSLLTSLNIKFDIEGYSGKGILISAYAKKK